MDNPVRQCWLNTETGVFSKSWLKGEYDTAIEHMLRYDIEKIGSTWKLIEYTVLNDGLFEFMDCMRLR